jgi:hypothetical protein
VWERWTATVIRELRPLKDVKEAMTDVLGGTVDARIVFDLG